jgi:signal peptidase I
VSTRRAWWPAVGVVGLTLLIMGGRVSGGALPAVAAPAAAGAPDTIVLRVASVSMEPTLRPGTFITVDLRAYRTRAPSIGDIVVFHPPHGADFNSPRCGVAREGARSPRVCGVPVRQASKYKFVMRLVALPGDRISIRNGHLIRNGVPEKDPYIRRCGMDLDCNFRSPVVLPPGDYFMLGDNRGFSDDSRFWGPVRRSWILGKVVR